MALIKVTDLAYGRLRAPDLDTAEEFLTHSAWSGRRGRQPRSTCAAPMGPTTCTSPRRVMPGSWGSPTTRPAWTTSRRSPRRRALGIESIDEPGGGKRVRLKEPNGYQVEVVYGIKALKPVRSAAALEPGSEGLSGR